MKGIQLVCLALVLLWVGCAANAWATTIMFTDLSSYQSAVTALGFNSTKIDFDNTTRTTSGGIDTVTAGNVTFSPNSPGVPLTVVGQELHFDFNERIQVMLPGSIYAFGFDLGELSGGAGPNSGLGYVVLPDGETFGSYKGKPSPNMAFFGFLSDTPFSSFMMKPFADGDSVIDNFTYAQAADPVPEPAVLLLLGSGLFGFGVMRRSYKKTA